jgi:hypothetical protein
MKDAWGTIGGMNEKIDCTISFLSRQHVIDLTFLGHPTRTTPFYNAYRTEVAYKSYASKA